MAANLVLGRSLQVLDAAGGMVMFQDTSGGWQRDRFALPGRLDLIDPLSPVLQAMLEWTLYTEKPLAISNLRRSRWSQHLLKDSFPHEGSAEEELPAVAVAATPLAQRGAIWGAIAVYRQGEVEDVMPFLGQLAELATEPLSSLGAARPEGVR